jgi:Family of unknown function (DUF5681)
MLEPSETETVGYKQPPRKTQFKPGVSGNPGGRPRKRKLDISLSLNTALNDKNVVIEHGKTLTGLEAFVQSVVDRVLQGDSKAIPPLMRLCTKAKLFNFVTDPTRLTGVVVAPPKYRRDAELGIQEGWYKCGRAAPMPRLMHC